MSTLSLKLLVEILFLSCLNFFRNVFTESVLVTPFRGKLFLAIVSCRPFKNHTLILPSKNSYKINLPISSTFLLLTSTISCLN